MEYSAGLELFDAGDRVAAREKFRQALKINPSFERAKQQLDKCKEE
jgi:Tfp pilus assembly protein PilF